MLDYIIKKTHEYIFNMPKKERKKYGQFFTSKETAVYMASLFDLPDVDTISILDPGTGSGILSAALIDRIDKNSSIKVINLTCYENDKNIECLLQNDLQYIKENIKATLCFEIKNQNYITSQSDGFDNTLGSTLCPKKYDLIISNPPYIKLGKNAPEARAMPSICYGAPNLYFLFAAMSLFNLLDNGQMVYIIPRSWTSGAYFKAFRRYLLNEGKLEHIHLFVRRDKVFDKENVLQETVILKIRKTYNEPLTIAITSSDSNCDFNQIRSIDVPYKIIVSGKNQYVYLVTTLEEVDLLKKINQWKNTLPTIGLKMKTGLTVDFREREYLRDMPEEYTIPLFFSQHLRNGRILYPSGRIGEYLIPNKPGLLQKNSNYLFVKRFTSKEESRRLQCGIYLAHQFEKFDYISTQNKINFIDNSTHDLLVSTVYGLYVLFNSSPYDKYYRILNGSTQVNSTEINTIPVPQLDVINQMGEILIGSGDLSEENCNKILEDFLNGKEGRSKKCS